MFFQQGLIWLFLLSGGATVSNAATNSNTVRFPLLSHEGLQERRLLEQLQSSNRSLSNPETGPSPPILEPRQISNKINTRNLSHCNLRIKHTDPK